MQTKYKRIISILIDFMTLFLGLGCINIDLITNYQIKMNQKSLKSDIRPKKSPSGSIFLNYDVGLTISGYSDNYIIWEFESSPKNHMINVIAMNNSQFQLYLNLRSSCIFYSLSNNNSSINSGNFSVPYGDTWHIVFSNRDVSRNVAELFFRVTFYNQSHTDVGSNRDLNSTIQLGIIGLGIGVGALVVSIIAYLFLKRLKNKK